MNGVDEALYEKIKIPLSEDQKRKIIRQTIHRAIEFFRDRVVNPSAGANPSIKLGYQLWADVLFVNNVKLQSINEDLKELFYDLYLDSTDFTHVSKIEETVVFILQQHEWPVWQITWPTLTQLVISLKI